jgi:hypothetical protein
MTGSEYLRRLREKDVEENLEGIKEVIMNLRMFLHKLNVVKLPDSSFNSYTYIMKHSPLSKPPTRV